MEVTLATPTVFDCWAMFQWFMAGVVLLPALQAFLLQHSFLQPLHLNSRLKKMKERKKKWLLEEAGLMKRIKREAGEDRLAGTAAWRRSGYRYSPNSNIKRRTVPKPGFSTIPWAIITPPPCLHQRWQSTQKNEKSTMLIDETIIHKPKHETARDSESITRMIARSSHSNAIIIHPCSSADLGL